MIWSHCFHHNVFPTWFISLLNKTMDKIFHNYRVPWSLIHQASRRWILIPTPQILHTAWRVINLLHQRYYHDVTISIISDFFIVRCVLSVYPVEYRDNILFDNGTFVLLQSFANFSGYAEESDFTVTVTMQVKYRKALWVFVWQWLSRLSVVG